MGWKCTWKLKCDGCGGLGPRDESSGVAEEKALAECWERILDCWGIARHRCPWCGEHGLPEWWQEVIIRKE